MTTVVTSCQLVTQERDKLADCRYDKAAERLHIGDLTMTMASAVNQIEARAEEAAAKPAGGPDQVKLALERTFLAYERTLMAWIRTSTSMITFGFALYKFYFYLHQDQPPSHGEQFFSARIYGLCIMGIGVIALLLATMQHWQQLKALNGHNPEALRSLSLVIAALVGSLGVVAFTFGIFRL